MGCAVLRGLAAVRHLYRIAHQRVKYAVAQMFSVTSISYVVRENQITGSLCTSANSLTDIYEMHVHTVYSTWWPVVHADENLALVQENFDLLFLPNDLSYRVLGHGIK